LRAAFARRAPCPLCLLSASSSRAGMGPFSCPACGASQPLCGVAAGQPRGLRPSLRQSSAASWGSSGLARAARVSIYYTGPLSDSPSHRRDAVMLLFDRSSRTTAARRGRAGTFAPPTRRCGTVIGFSLRRMCFKPCSNAGWQPDPADTRRLRAAQGLALEFSWTIGALWCPSRLSRLGWSRPE
jgi:hypothetical protein